MDFFAELQKLRDSRPVPSILTVRSENCDYSPYHANGKNCYLIVGHNLSEDCMYGIWVGECRNCVDCFYVDKCELCYECVECRECYSSNFCQSCTSCTECDFCYDCKNCTDCFGCVNLRNRNYCIFNEQYSKEEYFEKVAAIKNSLEHGVEPPEFTTLKNTLPHIAMQGLRNEDVFGNFIYNSKNAFYCFDAQDIEDCAYIFNALNVKNTVDCSFTAQGSELNYMCHSAVTDYNCNFCNICWYSQNLEYCEYVFNSHDCFGCVSRNHAEYEILNQKYSKDQYFKKVAEIKDQLQNEGSYGRWWWTSPY